MNLYQPPLYLFLDELWISLGYGYEQRPSDTYVYMIA